MNDIVSNAFNFSEFINSGVDPRTGSYSINFSLGELLSNQLSGPNYQLTISHSFLNHHDEGFGLGWSISMSAYNKNKRILTLGSGKSFEVSFSKYSNEIIMIYRKVKDVRAYLIDDMIKIVYKGGKADYIDYESGKLVKTSSSLGHEIFFEYKYYNGDNCLCKVYDSSGSSIYIDHWSYQYYTIIKSVNVNGDYERGYLLSKFSRGQGLLLSKVSMVNNSELNTEIKYRYVDDIKNYIITEVTYYTGLVEQIDYDYDGHFLPVGNENIKSIPNVKMHMIYPGLDQPAVVSQYEYSRNNYLGRGVKVLWTDGIDILFHAESDYRYSSKEVLNRSLVVERVYNKYHLMESEKYFRDDILYKEVDLEYYADLNKAIDEQPCNYSYLRNEKTTYYYAGEQRSEVIEYAFDDYGNCIYERDKDGTETFLEYYSMSGESDNCPPNLNEFVCYLKKTETHPVSRACGEESIWKRYKYTLINTLNESVYIAESEMKTSYGETTTSTYFENVASPGLCGLVSKVLVSLDGEPSGYLTFEYKFEDNMRISIVTLTGFDGKSTTKIETQDLYSGNLISKVDHEGLETRYTYNQSGQYTAIEVAPDTDRYAIKRFDYDYTQGNNSLLITGSKGHQQKYIYDGMGREVYHLSQDEFGDFQAINETHYDAEGRVAYSIERDWYNGEPVEYQTQYYYSLFGELDYTVLPNGNLLLSHFNPVKLTSITGTEGLSYDIVEHDINGKPVKESRFTPEGQLYSSSQRFYDSHGQTIKATDPLGHSSYYSYDYLGRSLTVTDPTNTVKSLEYAPNSADPLITKIRVAGRVVGERTYDGLQRIVAETQGEVITSYSYRDNQTSPSEQSSSQQPTWSFDYDPLLKKNIRASTNSTLLTFEYDSSTGKLVGSKNEKSKNSYQYDNQGRLIKEIRTINDEKYESTYAYSFLGQLVAYVDYLGNVENYIYDNYRNLIEIEKTGLDGKRYITEFEYDKYNRLVAQYCYDSDESVRHRLEHHFYWDHFSRETNRIVVKSGAIHFSLKTEFDISDRIILKEKSREGKTLRKEEFNYDRKSRLIDYKASGPECPKNNYGFEIMSQTFTYDDLDNIDTVVSTFKNLNQDIETYHYENVKDLTQLTRIEHSTSGFDTVNVQYDGRGNIIVDEKNQSYVYDDDDHLVLVKNELNETISDYSYNAEGQLVSQTVDNGIPISYLYRGDQLVNEVSGNVSTSYLRYVNKPILRLYNNSGSTMHQFLAIDKNGSVMSEVNFSDSNDKNFSYTPFGYKSNR